MIIFFIFLVMLLLGIVFIKIGESSYLYDTLTYIGAILTVIGTTCFIIILALIIIEHATASKVIVQNKIDYDGLCKRYEIIKSEYEDVSKSDVIADITAWNIKVYNIKYWTENPWTNWFNPREIADNLYYIPLE